MYICCYMCALYFGDVTQVSQDFQQLQLQGSTMDMMDGSMRTGSNKCHCPISII